ncbi:MAG: hypothetical protein IPG34_05445 [Rhodocyclaceae bacterium]|nr:hypothetical protein [Rhodocyclaceae bacterium]
MRNSQLLDLQSPLVVACHDAGAANLIAAWLREWPGEIRLCLAGPAVELWRRLEPEVELLPLDRALAGAAMLLSGTGWASEHEHAARRQAQSRGIRSIAAVDHWANYRDRFIRHGELILPNELWVADAYAQAEAQRCFPGMQVRQLPNLYLQDLVDEVAASKPVTPAEKPARVLYVLEPIRHDWGAAERHDVRSGELQAFEYFLSYLEGVGAADAHLVLRPHPSDPTGKYDDWFFRFADLNLEIDGGTPLARQIASADWVVGCESFALVAALEAGRLVFSSLPPWAPPCSLPHRELRHVHHLQESAA